jgi:DNA-directed RNA polymerase specialized sigma24 family protein
MDKYTAINLISRYHKDYVDMARAIAGNNMSVRNYAEDYVQEAYLRLLRYDDLYDKVIGAEEKVSKGYVFFVLRSIIINDLKKKSNLKYSFMGDEYDMEEKYMLVEEFDEQRQAEDELEQKMFTLLDRAVADPTCEIEWFDAAVFKKYCTTRKSYKTISEESGVGNRTIYLSMKRCRLYIAEHLYDDYKEFIEKFGKK